jgi:hypothetical protein
VTRRRLHEVLGLPDPERAAPGDDDVPVELARGALDFRLAGGVLGLADWDAQSPMERRALVEAGRRLLALGAGSTDLADDDGARPDAGRTAADEAERARLVRRGLHALHEPLRARGVTDAGAEQLWSDLARVGQTAVVLEVATGRMSADEAVGRVERLLRAAGGRAAAR